MSRGVGRLLSRAERTWQTLSHVPPRQLLRRVELTARFRLSRFFPAAGEGVLPRLAELLPTPPFPERSALMRKEGAGLVLCLPWGERQLQRPLPWGSRSAAADSSARADINNLHFMEYLESVDDGLATELIEEWIRHNPAGEPGAWRHAWRAYNLSIRVAMWLELLARRRDRLPPATVDRAAASLASQLRYLERHLETDLRGNHLIKNLRALAWGGACFVGPDADRWAESARTLLRRELAEQILPDGSHYERSPAYHCQVMGDLLACRAALRRPLPELDDALDRMASVLPRYTHPDGAVAPWNDGGLSMALAPAELLETHRRLGGAPTGDRLGPFALADAGYYGLRASGELVLVDCGELGPGYLPGHGHCDLLSFEWSTHGRRIIVDQGTHQYVGGSRRWASRCTASHNTLAIDGAEQSDIYGAFRCGRRARPKLLRFVEDGAGFRFEGSHDGYAALPGAPRHVRCVEARPGRLRIEDRLEGGIGQPATSRLLLHPDCSVEPDGGGWVIRSGPVAVRLAASVPVTSEPAEWYPDIHVAWPTTRLIMSLPPAPRSIEMRLTSAST
ncbi:MAG: alginate lyase family protein [Geminicoccaceae bacterium]